MSFAAKSSREELDPKFNKITSEIIAAAMAVHSALGPGLLESAYQACLVHELRKRGLHIETELPVPVVTTVLSSSAATGLTLWSSTPWLLN